MVRGRRYDGACSATGCTERARSLGMCRAHYQRARNAQPVNTAQPPPFGIVGRLDEEDGRVLCHACGRWLVRIGGRHLARHDISEDEYRGWAGLSPDRALAALPLRERLSETSSATVTRIGADWDPVQVQGPPAAREANRRPKRLEERLNRRDQDLLVAAYQRLRDRLDVSTVTAAVTMGWSQTRLAPELGVDRRWVRRRLADEAAGHVPELGPALPGDTLAIVVARYRAGDTTREIAADVGVDHTTVSKWLRRAGVPTRRTGPRGRTDVPDRWIVRLRDVQGREWADIARTVGMSKAGVANRYSVATTGARRWPHATDG